MGRLRRTQKIVLPQDKPLKCSSTENNNLTQPSSGINIEISVSFDLNRLISGIDGFVWATKNFHQAEIISNALKVQNIELEIVVTKFENTFMHLIKIINEKDIKYVMGFIKNDKSGLRLKPDWTYPEGKQNESFARWINE